MPEHASRRTFLIAAGAGSAAVGTGVGAGALLTGAASTALGAPDDGASSNEAVVAYVRDVDAGEITVMVGDRATVVTDRAMARSLSRLAG